MGIVLCANCKEHSIIIWNTGTRRIYVEGLAELFGFHVPTIVGSSMTFANGWRGEFLTNLMLNAATFVVFGGFIDICCG